jgi:hypothetical protein
MKNFTLISVLFLSMQICQGQVMLTEDFSGTAWPPSGWTIDAQNTNWSRVSTSMAGGTSPELRFAWFPQFHATTRFISPSVNLSANTQGTALVQFRYMVDHYSSSFTVGLAVRKNNASWETAWSESVNSNLPAQLRTVNIPAGFVTSSNFQFAFYFTGNSTNINYLYIDDVMLLVPYDFDLGISSLDIKRYSTSPVPVKGAVVNYGTTPITSFDLNWQIEDGPVHTTSITGLNLQLGSSYNFQADQNIVIDPGVHTVSIFISNINNQASDNNPENDIKLQQISVPFQTATRRPMFEQFTSSTCPPCATFNNSFFNNFINQNAESIALVKYQMNWPGAGDPYYTPEGGLRRVFYGVTGVPTLYVNGKLVANQSAAVNAALNEELAKPAFLDIEGKYFVQGNNLILKGNLMPYAQIWDVTLHTIIVEGSTTGNVGSNGETIFHHVMMKMLPNANGSQATLTAFEEFPINYTQNMSSTFVEEMHDLKVVVFLQDNLTKEILQAGYFDYYPAVIVENTNIDGSIDQVDPSETIIINLSSAIYHEDGSEVTNESLQPLISFTKLAGKNNAVGFSATINDQKDQITIVPDDYLDFATSYNIHGGPFYDFWPMEIDITFTTRAIAGAPLASFNIDNNSQNIPINQTIMVNFNQKIRMADGQDIDNSNVHQIIEFRLNNASGEAVDYNALINEHSTEVAITADPQMLYDQLYYLEIKSLMGIDDQVSDPVAIVFTTEQEVGIIDPAIWRVNIYPNPARNFIVAEPGEFEGIIEINIIDSNGNLVIRKTASSSRLTIDISGLSAGQYFVEFKSDKRRVVHPVQVVK